MKTSFLRTMKLCYLHNDISFSIEHKVKPYIKIKHFISLIMAMVGLLAPQRDTLNARTADGGITTKVGAVEKFVPI